MRPSPPATAKERLVVLALLLAHGGLAWFARTPGVRTSGDDATYLLLARDVLHGTYRNLHLVGTPPHTMYPPGYPTALALWDAFGFGLDWLVVLSIVASVGTLLVVFVFLRPMVGPRLAILALGVLAFNSELVNAAGELLSEPLYMFLSVTTLLLLARDTARTNGAAAILGIASALTRSAGVTLLPVVALGLLRSRRFVTLAVFLIAAVGFVGSWQVRSLTEPHKYVGRSYVAEFQQAPSDPNSGRTVSLVGRLAGRVAVNSRHYVEAAIPYVLAIPRVPGLGLSVVLRAFVALVGIVVSMALLWPRSPAVAWYVGLYAALLAVWPWPVGRFLIPLIPMLGPAVVFGWHAVGQRLHPRMGVTFALVLAGLMTANGMRRILPLVSTAARCERGHSPPDATCQSPEEDTYLNAILFLRDSVPQDALVLSSKPATVYYYSQRRGIMRPVPALPGPDSLMNFLRSEHVKFVLLGSVMPAEVSRLAPSLAASCRSFGLRKAFPPYTVLLDLTPSPEPEPSGTERDACAALAAYADANLEQDFLIPP